MQKSLPAFIALYDASPEHAHFTSPIMASRARALGKAMGAVHFGAVARLGSPVVAAVFETLADAKIPSIALSPAVSRTEHEHAYRLPKVSAPLIFTGKGALGADMVALESADAVLIFGSHPDTFENIITAATDSQLPIGVLTDEESPDIHERVRAIAPHLTSQLFISHDPNVLVREIGEELRRRRLEM